MSVPWQSVSPGIGPWWNQGRTYTVSRKVRSDFLPRGCFVPRRDRAEGAPQPVLTCPVGHEPSSVIQAANPYRCILTDNQKILVIYNEQTLDPNIPISICSLPSTRLRSHLDFGHKPLFLWWTDAEPLSWVNLQFPDYSEVPIRISQLRAPSSFHTAKHREQNLWYWCLICFF